MIITQLKNSFDSICKSNGRFFSALLSVKSANKASFEVLAAEEQRQQSRRLWDVLSLVSCEAIGGYSCQEERVERTLHKRVHPQDCESVYRRSGAISHVWVKPGQKRKEMLPKVCKYHLLPLNLATTEIGATISHLFCFPPPPLPLLVGDPSYCKIFWLSNKSGANT